MTEYFVQPGTRVPLGAESTTPPDTSVPRGNPELGDGGVVQVIDAEWKRRAGVARDLAAELAEALDALNEVAIQNHYGQVEEGDNFFTRVGEFLKNLTEQMSADIAKIQNVATACDEAHSELTLTDSKSASLFQT